MISSLIVHQQFNRVVTNLDGHLNNLESTG